MRTLMRTFTAMNCNHKLKTTQELFDDIEKGAEQASARMGCGILIIAVGALIAGFVLAATLI